MKNYDAYTQPTDRDYYLFDALRGEGLDLTDPHDWVNIGILSEDPRISEALDKRQRHVA